MAGSLGDTHQYGIVGIETLVIRTDEVGGEVIAVLDSPTGV